MAAEGIDFDDTDRAAEPDWEDFGRKIDAIMKWPVVAEDPICRALIGRMAEGPEPALFVHLVQMLSDRGLELAMARHGPMVAPPRRRGLDTRPALDDDGPPSRVMLRL